MCMFCTWWNSRIQRRGLVEPWRHAQIRQVRAVALPCPKDGSPYLSSSLWSLYTHENHPLLIDLGLAQFNTESLKNAKLSLPVSSGRSTVPLSHQKEITRIATGKVSYSSVINHHQSSRDPTHYIIYTNTFWNTAEGVFRDASWRRGSSGTCGAAKEIQAGRISK